MRKRGDNNERPVQQQEQPEQKRSAEQPEQAAERSEQEGQSEQEGRQPEITSAYFKRHGNNLLWRLIFNPLTS